MPKNPCVIHRRMQEMQKVLKGCLDPFAETGTIFKINGTEKRIHPCIVAFECDGQEQASVSCCTIYPMVLLGNDPMHVVVLPRAASSRCSPLPCPATTQSAKPTTQHIRTNGRCAARLWRPAGCASSKAVTSAAHTLRGQWPTRRQLSELRGAVATSGCQPDGG